MRHSYNYNKNVCWIKIKKKHELLAVDSLPLTDKDGVQNDKIYERKGEIKILRGTKPGKNK